MISIILSLAAVMSLSSCARKDPYKWEGHSYQELRSFYRERLDEFQNVADIIAGNRDFWEKGREYPEAEGLTFREITKRTENAAVAGMEINGKLILSPDPEDVP